MFEAFLLKYPNDKRWTPDAMFRLAELYYEKSAEEYLDADEAYKKALDTPSPPDTPPPRVDYTPTINLYRRLLTEFPSYRFLDAAYYLLGFCLGEMGEDQQAKQALLALVCSNRFKPLDTPVPTPKPSPRAPGASANAADEDFYKECTPVRKESKFIPEAWTRIGEFHFDNPNELKFAIAAFRKVLTFKDSPYYDRALYKLAWSYYRDNRFPEAVREFDNLVKYADQRTAAGQKVGSDLRPEAIQYLGVSFGEPDWDGDTLPDPITGLQRAMEFYKGREKEPHVREVFQRLGDIYFDQTKYQDAIAVYKALLAKWPYYSDAPRVQDRIVHAYEKDRNLVAAAKERETLGRSYTKGSDWYQHNKDNPEALAVARQLAEDALLTAATNVHAAAQACKTKWLENQKDTKKLEECKKLYATSAELYEKFLAAYPNSKRSYEFSAFYADALYYSGQLKEAIVAYQNVRDSQLDNRYQEDAAFRMIKTYEEMIDDMKKSKAIDDPPIPDEKNTKPPVIPVTMPDIYKKYLEAIDWYVEHIKNDRISDLKYAAAVITLRYRDWPTARQRLSADRRPVLRHQVRRRLQGLRRDPADLLHRLPGPGRGAEGLRARPAADRRRAVRRVRLRQGGRGEGLPGAHRADQVVGEDDDHHQASPALHGERGEGDRQAADDVPVGTGRHRAGHRPGGARPRRGGAATATKTAPSTQLDVGLALDLIDVVNANPQRSGRAHRAQQRLRHLREAVPVRRGDEVLRAPLRQLSRFGVGQGGAVERVAQPLPLLRVRPGGQGLPDRRAGSEVRAVRAPQGGAGPGRVDARQRSAVHARRGSLQEVLRVGGRQAAGQRAGLLLRVQRLREGERHRPLQRLPQGLHQEVRQAAGGG